MCATMDALCSACLRLNGAMMPPGGGVAAAAAAACAAIAASQGGVDTGSGSGAPTATPHAAL